MARKSTAAVMEFHFNSESLICAVRDRPYVYDYGLPDYSNKAKKSVGWLEICEEVLPNWAELSASERECCELELQKKWRNMRDSYTKEYKKQMLAEITGGPVPRPYLYYQALSFLENVVRKRHTKNVELTAQRLFPSSSKNVNKEEWSTEPEYLNDEILETTDNTDVPSFQEIIVENITDDDGGDDADDDDRNDDNGNDDEYVETKNNDNKKIVLKSRVTAIKKRRKIEVPKDNITTTIITPTKKPKLTDTIINLASAMKEQYLNDVRDPDKMFLLSLLPYFKQFNHERKLQTKIQLLSMLKQKIDDQRYE